MKNFWTIAMVAALMVSCNNFDDAEGVKPVTGEGDAIEFYAGDATRTTYFEGDGLGVNWEAGDVVPIIARGYLVNEETGVTSEKRTRTFYQATNTGASTGFELFTDKSKTPMTWSSVVGEKPICEQDIDFYAVHCGQQFTTATTVAAGVLVYSSYVQEQAAANDYSHIGNYTVLATDKVTREAGNTAPVNFKFTNCQSVVELTLKGDASKQVSKITLSSTDEYLGFSLGYLCVEDWLDSTDVVEEPLTIYPRNGKNTYNSTTPEPVFSKTVTLNLTESVTLSEEGVKFYFVVLPGEHTNGAITVTTYYTDETYAENKMGAVKFEKNKVYRPTVTVKEAVAQEASATIKHIFSEGYSLPVPFVNGAKVLLERYTYALSNVPESLSGFEVSTVKYSTYPTTNKIVAMTEGWAYLLVGASAVADYEAIDAFFSEKGWASVTAIPTEEITAEPTVDSNILYYGNKLSGATAWYPMAVYGRYMQAGEEFDLTEYVAVKKNFQGIRPLAKSIINESDSFTLALNFTDNAQGWATQSNFNNSVVNAFEGAVDYVFPGGEAYELLFSRTEVTTWDGTTAKDGGGCALHKDGYLLMYLRYSQRESIGLPIVDGYRLVRVDGTSVSANVTPTIGISYNAAPADVEWVCDEYTMEANKKNNFTFELEGTYASDRYYFYGVDEIKSNHDPRIESLTLTYEKEE